MDSHLMRTNPAHVSAFFELPHVLRRALQPGTTPPGEGADACTAAVSILTATAWGLWPDLCSVLEALWQGCFLASGERCCPPLRIHRRRAHVGVEVLCAAGDSLFRLLCTPVLSGCLRRRVRRRASCA
uniref:Uncharacterized protein n=1 Tax=Chlamydomonas euryale TaxID=1486919 RepID=A0A7R9V2G4_9CHLO